MKIVEVEKKMKDRILVNIKGQSVKEQELVRDMEETEMSIVIAKGI